MHLTHSSSTRSTKEESFEGRRLHKGRVSFAGEDTTIHAQPLNTRERHATMPPTITLYVIASGSSVYRGVHAKEVARNNLPR